MSNPFLKKNPFLSMWLSNANALAGTMRAHATAQVKREAGRATKEASQDVMAFWAQPWLTAFGTPTKAKPRRRRR